MGMDQGERAGQGRAVWGGVGQVELGVRDRFFDDTCGGMMATHPDYICSCVAGKRVCWPS